MRSGALQADHLDSQGAGMAGRGLLLHWTRLHATRDVRRCHIVSGLGKGELAAQELLIRKGASFKVSMIPIFLVCFDLRIHIPVRCSPTLSFARSTLPLVGPTLFSAVHRGGNFSSCVYNRFLFYFEFH